MFCIDRKHPARKYGHPDYEKRNEAISRARNAGKYLQTIADEHGLSLERVRQICIRADRIQ